MSTPTRRKPEKKVRIALELSEDFVRRLRTSVGLAGLGPDKDQHTPIQALAVVVLAEARGALPEQVHMLTPMEWRNDIQPVSEMRQVTEGPV